LRYFADIIVGAWPIEAKLGVFARIAVDPVVPEFRFNTAFDQVEDAREPILAAGEHHDDMVIRTEEGLGGASFVFRRPRSPLGDQVAQGKLYLHE